MAKLLDEDYISCPICLELYYSNENKIPLCLECGHTICKKCLDLLLKDQKIECPIDKRVIDFSLPNQMKVENLIIKTAISIIKSIQLNAKSLTRLSMFYCKACDMFISNYVKEIHLSVNHQIISVSQYTLKLFDYISANLNNRRITPGIKMYLLAYYYQIDNFKQVKSFKMNQIVNINNKMFTFYGENYLLNEKNSRMYKILKCIMTGNDKQYENHNIKKGIIIGINSQIMQGFFLFSGDKPNIAIRGFGLLNYHDASFFGLVSLIPDSEHSGFALDFGVIKDNHILLYGIFNHNFNEYPLYHLSYGEEITLTIKGVHVIRRNFVNLETEEVGDPYEEIDSTNHFFLHTNNHLRFESGLTGISDCQIQFTFSNPCIYTKNLVEISFVINNNNSLIKNLTLKLKNTESSYDYDYLEKSINDCYIVLNTDIAVLFLREEDEKSKLFMPSIIISDCYDLNIKKNFKGYKITTDEEEVNKLIQDLSEFRLKNIILEGSLLPNLMENFLTSQLNHSFAEYQIFHYSSLLRVINADYFTIDFEKGTVFCQYFLGMKKNSTFYHKEIKTMMIFDLLPNFYSSVLLKPVSSRIKTIEEIKKVNTCCRLI